MKLIDDLMAKTPKAGKLMNEKQISTVILQRLIKGLNRIFTGMLIDSDRDIFLATSGNYSQAKICRILIDKNFRETK